MKMLQVVNQAREAMETIIGRKPEVVSRCEPQGEKWLVTIEVVETKARITDNDMMATYQLMLDSAGEVTGIDRVRQYVRARAAA
jgi:Gas vesicle synthesis protein GvpO